VSVTIARIRRWYGRYNREFFGGKLPPNIPILYDSRKGSVAQLESDSQGSLAIVFNPVHATEAGVVRITLLHEMVHVEQWPARNHGKRYQKRIDELYAAGAYRGLL
jgi:hypothetical protein